VSTKVVSAGATATTEAASSGVSTWVCVSCRYITAHRRPWAVVSISSVVCSMVLRWASSHAKCSVCSPSVGSTSGRGSHPNGSHADAVTASASTRRIERSGTGSSVTAFLYAGDMDVRSIEEVAPVVEHNGTVPSGGS